MNRSTRLIGQLAVLIPTIAMSIFLGQRGVAPVPRLFASLGFGMILITMVAFWQRRRG